MAPHKPSDGIKPVIDAGALVLLGIGAVLGGLYGDLSHTGKVLVLVAAGATFVVLETIRRIGKALKRGRWESWSYAPQAIVALVVVVVGAVAGPSLHIGGSGSDTTSTSSSDASSHPPPSSTASPAPTPCPSPSPTPTQSLPPGPTVTPFPPGAAPIRNPETGRTVAIGFCSQQILFPRDASTPDRLTVVTGSSPTVEGTSYPLVIRETRNSLPECAAMGPISPITVGTVRDHVFVRFRTATATYIVFVESVTATGIEISAAMGPVTVGDNCATLLAVTLDQALLEH